MVYNCLGVFLIFFKWKNMFILFKYFGIENSVKEYSKNIIIKFYIGYFFE